jgi:23S rRNA G2445 N2-methylase RlmL
MFEPRRGGVMCIEKSHRHAEFIRSNAAAAGYGEILEVRTQDVFPVMNQLAESGGNLI